MDVNNRSFQPSFTSRNVNIRKIGDLTRRIHQVYPTLSNTALKRFCVKDKSRQNQQFLTFVSALIGKLRKYYLNSNSNIERIIKIINGIEKTKTANCNEQAILTGIALKLNGFKNVKLYSLHSYNKSSGIIKDMDHLIVGINIKRPENYLEKLPSEPIALEHLFSPNNESIIVDNWAGITENGKSYLTKCKGEINLNKKIKNDEKILLFPHDDLNLSEYQIEMLHHYFPKLNFYNRPTKNLTILPLNDKIEGFEEQEVNHLKVSKGLKPRIKVTSATNKESMLSKISKLAQKIAVM